MARRKSITLQEIEWNSASSFTILLFQKFNALQQAHDSAPQALTLRPRHSLAPAANSGVKVTRGGELPLAAKNPVSVFLPQNPTLGPFCPPALLTTYHTRPPCLGRSAALCLRCACAPRLSQFVRVRLEARHLRPWPRCAVVDSVPSGTWPRANQTGPVLRPRWLASGCGLLYGESMLQGIHGRSEKLCGQASRFRRRLSRRISIAAVEGWRAWSTSPEAMRMLAAAA